MNGIRYRSADEMKDSGIEWMGRIPKDWQARKLKYLAQCFPSNVDKKSNENEPAVKLCNYTDAYKNDFITANMSFMDATASKSQIVRYGLRQGDIVITKDSESPDDIGIPSFVFENIDKLVCGYHLSVVRTFRSQYSLFFYYQLRSTGVRNYFETRANGITRYALGSDDFNQLFLSVPSFLEQRKIANFLDLKTSQFDSIIAKKEQLIAKLEEAKKSLISEVVTGKVKIVDGKLVPRQPEEMKDSGVEWLGMIPKEWRATSLRWYITCRSGDFLENTKFEKECSLENSIPVIGGNGILGYSNNYNFSGIGIVVGRVGALCGNVHLINGEYWITDNSLIIGNDPTISTYYLDLWLRMINLNRFSNSTAQPLITGEIIKRCTICFPDEHEQVKIVDFYKQISDSFYNVYKRLTNQLALLKSAKQSLISEAVTGKIDLRDWEINEQGGAS